MVIKDPYIDSNYFYQFKQIIPLIITNLDKNNSENFKHSQITINKEAFDVFFKSKRLRETKPK